MTDIVDAQKIKLSLIHPNPFRNFDLNPIDSEHLDQITASFKDNGDFGVISVRPHPEKKGQYQQAFGHYRKEAMEKLGWKTADCKVDEHDDDWMLSAMIAENAGQQDDNQGSVLDSVAAVMCCVTHLLLTEVGDQAPRLGELGVNDADKARRQLFLHGVGEDVLWAYFKKGGQIGRNATQSGLATLKASTQYAKLMQGVIARILKEYDSDSEQVARAGKLQDAIDGKEESKKAANAGQPPPAKHKPAVVSSRSGRSSPRQAPSLSRTQSEKPLPPPKPARGEFDAKTASVFKTTNQLDTFRKIVTAPAMAAVLPVEKQMAVAKAIAAEAKKGGKDVTPKVIIDFTGDKLAEFYSGQTKSDKTAQKAAGRETAARRLAAARDVLVHGLAKLVDGATRYQEVLDSLDEGEVPAEDIEFIHKLKAYKSQIDKLFAAFISTRKAITP